MSNSRVLPDTQSLHPYPSWFISMLNFWTMPLTVLFALSFATTGGAKNE